jgi:uncharacterized protein (TIGR02453 family)
MVRFSLGRFAGHPLVGGAVSRSNKMRDKPLQATVRLGAAFPADTFRFFRELSRNNRKSWMDGNRDRYRDVVVTPLRTLLDRLTPAVLRLDSRFDVSGRTGSNFSRINRDIRFAADKSPYRTQMYLKFPDRTASETGVCELYVGVAADAITAGFRVYHSGRRSPLGQLVAPRATAHRQWLERQRRRLGRRCQSYWYATEHGEWTRHDGWPLDPSEWKKLKGWVVRRKMGVAAARRATFVREIERVFRDVFPLYQFTSCPDWNP